MSLRMITIAVSSIGWTLTVATAGDLRPVNLRCEYLAEPMGIDAARPRLSWSLESKDRDQAQTACQILVSSTREKLLKNEGDLWDSGKLATAETLQVSYAGRPLTSNLIAFWKVRVWDKEKAPSPYSEPARWEMGLLEKTDWTAKWICDPRPLPTDDAEMYKDWPAPLFRKTFVISKPVRRSRAYVSGLGYYELSLNGRRVGDHVLDPAWTTYNRRVLYSTYDVTALLKPGPNAAGICVGNGWYNPLPLRLWGGMEIRKHLTIGRPRTILQLNIEYEDGSRESVITDESWGVADSPIIRNSIYLGEIYDARKEIAGWDAARLDDASWRRAIVSPEPVGTLCAQMTPPIRAMESIKPAKISEPSRGTFIFDMGRNFSGWITLRVNAPAGQRIQFRYGELLYPDGTLNGMTAVCGQIKKPGMGGPGAPDVAFQSDAYICKGNGEETYTPRFTFHGFRYVEVNGYPGKPTLDAIEGHVLHSDVPSAGNFSCSNEMFNRVQEMVRRTYLSNLFGVQSDCPARERFGYGGDIVATSDMAMLNFDLSSFYAKVVRDFGDAARSDGGITETAPFVGISDEGLTKGAGPIGWGTVHPLLLWQRYQYYGDRRLLEEQYATAAKWLAYLDAHADGFFITRGLGDHETLAPKVVPLTSTAFYWLNTDLMARIAGVLDRSQDAEHFAKRADAIKAAFNERFLDRTTGKYASGSQACQSFALCLGLVPDELRGAAMKILLAGIAEHKNHLTTGIFGTKYLLAALSDNGRPDVACAIANQRDFPGWGHMLENGATTLWEHWEFSDNTFSHNHPMFGSISEWFIKTLAGIRPEEKAVGFDRIVIRPAILPDLTWVKCTHQSPHGPIVSEWHKEGTRLQMHVIIPPNTSATVHLPTSDPKAVFESDRPLETSNGARVKAQAGETLLQLGSGDYRFLLPVPH